MQLRSVLRLLIFVTLIVVNIGTKSLYAADQPPTVTLTASQPTLTVGDLVTVTLQVTHTVSETILPLSLDKNWGEFEVRRLSPVTTQANSDGSETSSQQVGVTLWMTGTHGTPPLPIKVVDGQGNQREVTAQPISLTVTSVLVGTDNTLRDLKAQATLPIPALWPWIVGAALGLLVLGYAGWWLVRRWRRRVKVVEVPVAWVDPRPAHQIALDELERLESLQLPAQRRFKEHYTLTTDVLRHYLSNGFAIPAIDQTTDEVRQAIKENSFTFEQCEHLLTLLSEADLVKFADLTPSEDEAAHLIANARSFVENTRVTR